MKLCVVPTNEAYDMVVGTKGEISDIDRRITYMCKARPAQPSDYQSVTRKRTR